MAASHKHDKHASAQTKAKKLSPIGAICFMLLFSWIFSILIEWCGMIFYWDNPGAEHSFENLITEYTWVVNDFNTDIIGGLSPAQMVSHMFNDWLGLSSGDNWFTQWLRSNDEIWLDRLSGLAAYDLRSLLLAAVNVTGIFLLRVSVLITSIPLFLLFSGVGIVDGLVKRDLRRWGAARESSMIYHYTKKMIWPSFTLSWFLYLSSPEPIHPTLVTVPFAVLTALLLHVTVRNFKKYI